VVEAPTPRRTRRFATLALLAALAALGLVFGLSFGASPSNATVDWRSGFEQSYSPWQGLQHQEDKPLSDSFNYVTSPVRSGSYSAQFIVKHGYGPYGGERTELCCGPQGEGAPGTEHWWAWSTYFPTDWVQPYHWGMFFQLHAGDDMPPAIALDAGADGAWLNVRTGLVNPNTVDWSYGSFPQVLTTLSKGHWNDFVLHVSWSKTDGTIELWHRLPGEAWAKVANLTHIPTLQYYSDGHVGQIYTKLGLYRGSYCSSPSPGCSSSLGVQPTNTLYQDAFVRGASFDEVVSSAWGDAASAATTTTTATTATTTAAARTPSPTTTATTTDSSSRWRYGRRHTEAARVTTTGATTTTTVESTQSSAPETTTTETTTSQPPSSWRRHWDGQSSDRGSWHH
jgi:hypothetical protein